MLTLTKTEVRENNWIRYFFRDENNYEFSVQKPNEKRIREKVKNENHPVGQSYLKKGLDWEIENGEVIDSSPEQVAEGWYNDYYKQGKTTKQLLAGLKSDLDKREQRQKEADEVIASTSASIDSAQQHLKQAEEILGEIKEIGKGKMFYNQNGLIVNEQDLNNIFWEYFRGTDLENVSYQWSEIISPSYATNIISFFWVEKGNPINTTLNRISVFVSLINQLKNSFNSFSDTQAKKAERAIKETEIKEWILKEAVKNNNLKQSLSNDPKLIALSYKIEKGEEVVWFYVATHLFNNKFGVNWSPLKVFSFLTTGLFGLVFLGYWFLSRVKAIVKRTKADNLANNPQQD